MTVTLAEVAEHLQAKLHCDAPDAGELPIYRCAKLDDAEQGDLTFLSNPSYQSKLADTRATAVIVSPKVNAPGKNLLITDDPYFGFRNAMVLLHGFRQHPPVENGPVSPMAQIHPTARLGRDTQVHPFAVISQNVAIGDNCVIYPGVFIGPGVKIGNNCLIHANVTIYDQCVLGNRVTLHSGCVIGQDGFGYATHQGEHHKIPQAGNVVIEDDVEMGACCTIDRAALGSTVIGRGTKFSDAVVIGHGSEIGPGNLFVAQVGLAGSTQTGQHVVMGGQAGAAGHLKIGDFSRIAGRAGVTHSLPGGEEYGGLPATQQAHARRQMLAIAKLPKLLKRVRQLEQQLAQLQNNQN